MAKKKLIKIASEIKNIRKVSSEILGSLASYGLSDDTAFDIRLCIEEAVRNAIVHGNRSDKRFLVRVSYWIAEGELGIEVEDEGKGFDCRALPDPTVDDNIMRASGRGVFLIMKLMDKVEFNETGNKITMVKKFR